MHCTASLLSDVEVRTLKSNCNALYC